MRCVVAKMNLIKDNALIKHHRVTLVPQCSLGSGSGSDQVVIHKDRAEGTVL